MSTTATARLLIRFQTQQLLGRAWRAEVQKPEECISSIIQSPTGLVSISKWCSRDSVIEFIMKIQRTKSRKLSRVSCLKRKVQMNFHPAAVQNDGYQYLPRGGHYQIRRRNTVKVCQTWMQNLLWLLLIVTSTRERRDESKWKWAHKFLEGIVWNQSIVTQNQLLASSSELTNCSNVLSTMWMKIGVSSERHSRGVGYRRHCSNIRSAHSRDIEVKIRSM